MRHWRSLSVVAVLMCASCEETLLTSAAPEDDATTGPFYDSTARVGDGAAPVEAGGTGDPAPDAPARRAGGDASAGDLGGSGDADAHPADTEDTVVGPEDTLVASDTPSTDLADAGETPADAGPATLPDAGPEPPDITDPPDPCAAMPCDDGLWCTADSCAGGACQHAHVSGCLVGGTCWDPGAKNPGNGCEQCSPDVATTAWTWDPGIPFVPTAPPGGAANRFDVATLSCSACGKECPADDDKCFCLDDFQALNSPGTPHFMGMGADTWRPAAWAQGNFAAVYIDDLNEGWTAGKTGAQAAEALLAAEAGDWPDGLASWFLLNEISAGSWPANASYRQYVVDYAATLKAAGKKPVVLAPFDAPGNAWPEWKKLAAVAFVGAQSYKGTTGEKVNASGNSVAYCKGVYQKTADAYVSVGVPLSKLFLVEHFGQTESGANWGRAGVSVAGWKNAIVARGNAAQQIGFAGFVSYGWGQNTMHATAAERLSFVGAYDSVSLP